MINGQRIKLEKTPDQVPDDWKHYRISIKIGNTSIFNPILTAADPDMAIKSALVAVITQYIPTIESIDFREKIEIINCTEHERNKPIQWEDPDGSSGMVWTDE